MYIDCSILGEKPCAFPSLLHLWTLALLCLPILYPVSIYMYPIDLFSPSTECQCAIGSVHISWTWFWTRTTKDNFPQLALSTNFGNVALWRGMTAVFVCKLSQQRQSKRTNTKEGLRLCQYAFLVRVGGILSCSHLHDRVLRFMGVTRNRSSTHMFNLKWL